MKESPFLVGGFILLSFGALAGFTVGMQVGDEIGRQRDVPMACEARCEVTMQAGKVIKTVCPDSLGRVP